MIPLQIIVRASPILPLEVSARRLSSCPKPEGRSISNALRYTVLSSSFNCSGGQLKRSAVLLSNFNPKHILDPKLRRVDSQKQRLLSWSRAVIACKPSNSPCPCSFIAILAKRSTLRDFMIIRNCANLLTERFLVTSLGNGQLF
jgi:hypothetical protein